MATVNSETKSVNMFDVFNVWETNFKWLNRLEEESLQVIEKQKEWIDSSSEQITQLENYSNKLTNEWKTNVQDSLAKAPKMYSGQNFTEWADKLEEITQISQNLAFSPMKASVEILSKSHANYELLYINTLEQQQKNRAEFLKPLEEATEQFKQTQEKFLKSFAVSAK
ncbi:MAG: hypothetical protein ACI35R_09570 [Bacillus sp. (in: firmicutes)]